jgi:hypothetical protein
VFTARYECNLYIQFGLFTAETWIRSYVSKSEICGGHSGTETGFSPSSYVLSVSIIQPTLQTHLHLYVAFVRKTNRGNLGNPKSLASVCIVWEKVLTIFK